MVIQSFDLISSHYQMVKSNNLASKKKVAAAAAANGKENAPAVNGSNGKRAAAGEAAKFKVPALPAAVDRYAELEKKKSAFSTLSAEAKVRAAAAPPIKESAVPVGMRRSDAKNRARYSDGIAAEPVAVHRNGDSKATKKEEQGAVASPVAASKKKEKSIKEMKAELAKKKGPATKKGAAPESTTKGEKRKLAEVDEAAAAADEEPSFLLQRMQQMANAAMEREIGQQKRSKRARQTTPSDSDSDGVHPLAVVPAFQKRVDTPHPVTKKSRLASGVAVEKKPHFDVEEVPYTVEEPDDSPTGQGKRGRLIKKKLFSSQDFAELEREMAAHGDLYDEDDDDDFMGDEDEEEDDEEEELTDEELEEMEDEEADMDDEDEEEVTDEELVSSDLDEEDAVIHPDDIQRTITFDDDDDEEEPESDEDEELSEVEMEDEEEEGEEGEDGHHVNGCCDDSDCEEDGSEMDGEEVSDEEEGDESDYTSDSSHVSDDSYGEAFVDDEMAAKAVTMSRESAALPGKGKKKKAGKGGAATAATAAAIDFTAFPFKDADSAVSAAKALDWLLSPCDAQTFFDDFFQSTSLVVRRGDPHYYGNLFSTSAMTALLRESCLEYGVNVNVALYAGGVRTTHNGTGRAYPLAIGDAIRAGCSVQLTNPQAYAAPVWYLCDALQEVFHCFVGANTYLTPAGASGFAPHWDEIDAFLLQVEGRKYWRVWAPESPDAELPLESSGNFTEADMAGRKPAFEGWIEQGDMLYIPRGFIHQARTDKAVHSLHVTVSAGRQWTFANMLQKLLPMAMDGFTGARAKLRRQLPPGLLDMSGIAELPDDYPLQEASESKLHAPLDRHMSVFRTFVGGMRECGVDLMAREFMRTALPPVLSVEEKQLSAWGNDGADLFEEKGASRITPATAVRFIRRHGQRLLFAAPEEPFVAHRMANARTYEGAEERTFPITTDEEPVFADLLSAYPEWTTVKELKMKKKAKVAFLTKLFNHGLIMVSSSNMDSSSA